jgi:hypothetical protein
MAPRRSIQRESESASLPIWQELLVGVEIVYLRVSPVYWGYGIPKGNGSAVVVIPGFMGTDFYLAEFRAWLRRVGYTPYDSGIGLNAECPNLLIRERLSETIVKAHRETGRKVHLIGHSLGGIMARAVAAQMPNRVASVVTLGSPLFGVARHPSIARAAELVRKQILERHGEGVLPNCYTSACTCRFVESAVTQLPKSIRETSIYTKSDPIVDWQTCRTGNCGCDFEVSATHIGLVFNPLVYQLVAERLAGKKIRRRF